MYHCKRRNSTLRLIVSKNKISYYYLIASIIINIVCFIRIFDVGEQYRLVAVLPFVYLLLLFCSCNYIDCSNPGMFTVMLVSFFRYGITPLVILLTEEFNTISTIYRYVPQAILVMAYEMLGVFFILIFYNPKNKRKKIDENIRNNKLVLFFAVIGAIFLLLDNSELIGSLSITSGVSKNSVELNEISGVFTILWQAICAFVFAYIMQIIFIKNEKRQKNSVLLLLLVCLIYLLIIYTGQARISRWYTIVTLIAATFWIIKNYPQKTITIILWIGLPTCIVLMIATILKNTTVGLKADFTTMIEAIFNSTNMDTYFAGPVNVSTVIALKKETGIGIDSLFYDMLNNFPALNHLIKREFASVNQFNSFIGRGDQIIPLVGQSVVWFSYVLAPFLSMFSIVLVKRLDLRYRESSSILTYLYAFTAVWSALMPILNFTIWLSWIYSRIVPAFVLFWLALYQYKRRIKTV